MPSLVMVGVNRVEDDDIELSEMLAIEQPRELGQGGESAFGSDLGSRFPFLIEPETGRRILSVFAHSAYSFCSYRGQEEGRGRERGKTLHTVPLSVSDFRFSSAFDKSLLYHLKHNRIQSLLDPPPATRSASRAAFLSASIPIRDIHLCSRGGGSMPSSLEKWDRASNASALQSRAVLQVAGIPSSLSNSLTAGLLCNASGRLATCHGSLAHLY
ncbi:predicted protein [Histoplasma capsulatum var. duboisii H88]|uniref:Predicted protein n=1 Tax=Ajellomyces capsulatus (strain H88) TaxID=544711 RepID=F0URH7_AJEC8|nr:predicted protein [Histoplasma capsulatum var. duboisii H88]